MGARLARMAGRAGREDKGPNRGSCGRGHRWLVSERTAFRTTVSQARIPTWMGLPARNRSLWSSGNGVTYASIPQRNAKTAASQRPPGRAKDGLSIVCFKSIGYSTKRLRVGWPLLRIFEHLWQTSLDDHVAGSTSL